MGNDPNTKYQRFSVLCSNKHQLHFREQSLAFRKLPQSSCYFFFSLGKCWVEKIGKRRAEPDHISRLIRHRHTFLFIHKRIVGFSFFLHCANRNYSGFRDIPTRVAQTFSKKQLDAFYPPPPLLISWLHCIRRGKNLGRSLIPLFCLGQLSSRNGKTVHREPTTV